MDSKTLIAAILGIAIGGGGLWATKDKVWELPKSGGGMTAEQEAKLDKALANPTPVASPTKMSPEDVAKLTEDLRKAVAANNLGEAQNLAEKLKVLVSSAEVSSGKFVMDNKIMVNVTAQLKVLQDNLDKEVTNRKAVEEERNRLKLAVSSAKKKTDKAEREKIFQEKIIELMLPYQEREQQNIDDLEAPHKAFMAEQARNPEMDADKALARAEATNKVVSAHRTFMEPIEKETQKRLDAVRKKLEREYEWMRK